MIGESIVAVSSFGVPALIYSAMGKESFLKGFGEEVITMMVTEPKPETAFGILSILYLARAPQFAYRFYKVVKGDHHIIDRPPPKEETVKATNLAPAPSAA